MLSSKKLELILYKKIISFKSIGKIFIAYSGGLDSSILLAVFNKLFSCKNYLIKVIHIDHNFNFNSLKLAFFAKFSCDNYKLPLISYKIKITKKTNIEESYRIFRFLAYHKSHIKNILILTGHNKNDLIENIYLSIARGKSFRFSHKNFKYVLGNFNMSNPLESFEKISLLHYTTLEKIKYFNDYSNKNEIFDRNYLRYSILKKLIQRWPYFTDRLLNFFYNYDKYNEFFFKKIFQV